MLSSPDSLGKHLLSTYYAFRTFPGTPNMGEKAKSLPHGVDILIMNGDNKQRSKCIKSNTQTLTAMKKEKENQGEV